MVSLRRLCGLLGAPAALLGGIEPALGLTSLPSLEQPPEAVHLCLNGFHRLGGHLGGLLGAVELLGGTASFHLDLEHPAPDLTAVLLRLA